MNVLVIFRKVGTLTASAGGKDWLTHGNSSPGGMRGAARGRRGGGVEGFEGLG